jgi:hypothetical protein
MTGPEKDLIGELTMQMVKLTTQEDDRIKAAALEQTLRLRQRQSDEERWGRQDHRADHMQDQLTTIDGKLDLMQGHFETIDLQLAGEQQRTETIVERVTSRCQELRSEQDKNYLPMLAQIADERKMKGGVERFLTRTGRIILSLIVALVVIGCMMLAFSQRHDPSAAVRTGAYITAFAALTVPFIVLLFTGKR